jgi:hypothetical protein
LVNAVEEDPNEISNTGSDSTKEETNNDSDTAHDLFLTNFDVEFFVFVIGTKEIYNCPD